MTGQPAIVKVPLKTGGLHGIQTVNKSSRRPYAPTFNGEPLEVDGANALIYGTNWVNILATDRVMGPPYTFSCWGYVDDATITNDYCCMQIQDEDVSNDYIRFGLTDSTDTPGYGHILIHWRDEGVETFTYSDSGTAITPRTWFHMAGVDAITSQACFLNGAAKGTSTHNRTAASIDGVNSLAVGREHDTSATDTWLGGLFWASIWNIDLSDTEVAWLAAGTPPWRIRPSNLIAMIPMDGRRDDTRELVSGALPQPSGGSLSGGTVGSGLPTLARMPGPPGIPLYETPDLFFGKPNDRRVVTF